MLFDRGSGVNPKTPKADEANGIQQSAYVAVWTRVP